ncbi:caspase family protein [Amycolatopsis acidicola]|uniref:Caspase family protein n=1 Tax=Amycolatopsis acidicola TaxID=2596893 RepID=A0A5N0UPM2_9PSEU|nr:caspase family protein [Amycolatopsis acidicola]KAA9152971.1 caspase family protein [Amycolatopsis acidicola]
MTRAAFLIGTSSYTDQSLRQLHAPAQDVERLGAVLGDPEVGAYEVTTHVDETAGKLTDSLREFLSGRAPEDALVIYFSGHGVKDVAGDLFLTGTDSSLDDLDHTAIPATELNRWLRACRSRRILLILDCCYSGAFGRGMLAKAGETVHVRESFSGRGLAIITATTAIEYAFEGTTLREDERDEATSTFTEALIHGLDTGEADDNLDQRITLDELYYYVFDTVREVNPGQTPCWYLIGGQGDFLVAARRPGTSARRSRTSPPTPAVTLRPDRRMLATAVPVAVLGGVIIWAGLAGFRQGALWSAAVVGILLVLAAILRIVLALTGRTYLEDRGVRVSPFRSATVPWPAILAVEARSGLFGKSLTVRRGDRPQWPWLPLPAPSRSWVGNRDSWAAALEKIREHSVLRGSPTVVVDRRWAPSAARAAVVIVLAGVLLVTTDRPWVWEGVIADGPPDACQALSDENIEAAVPSYRDLDIFGAAPSSVAVPSNSLTTSTCQRTLAASILGTPDGWVQTIYDVAARTWNRSAHQGAEDQLEDYRSFDAQHGRIAELTAPHPGYWLTYDRHATARLLCGNAVVTLDMRTTEAYPQIPDDFPDIADRAVSLLSAENPGLC